jgi:hypothetical protein
MATSEPRLDTVESVDAVSADETALLLMAAGEVASAMAISEPRWELVELVDAVSAEETAWLLLTRTGDPAMCT